MTAPMANPGAASPALDHIWTVLDAVADPEIPVVSLRELGILRDVRMGEAGVEVVITPTYSGCPAMSQMADDVAAKLAEHGIAGKVVTQLAPAWTTDWITPAARDKLRAYGIAPPHSVQATHAAQCGGGAQNARAQVLQFLPGVARATPAVACPQCGSTHTTLTSQFGSTACKALYRCLDCREPFDYFKPY